MDKYWVPQTGQDVIYERVLGAANWTELGSVVGTSDWTELRLVEKERQYGGGSSFMSRTLDGTVRFERPAYWTELKEMKGFTELRHDGTKSK